ncbi:MAG TPA: hypothetical protein EYP85_00600 [Armatimonadetes bacterium]|nr:hypothetical protein [Armatimonadota bacterium]
MHRRQRVGLALLGILWGGLLAAAAPQVRWYPSLAEAQKQQKGQPFFLYFRADWSRACRWFEEHTLTDLQVLQALQNFVAVKVNATLQPLEVKRHRVQKYPTLLFLDPEGKELYRTEGGYDVAGFLWILNHVQRQRARQGNQGEGPGSAKEKPSSAEVPPEEALKFNPEGLLTPSAGETLTAEEIAAVELAVAKRPTDLSALARLARIYLRLQRIPEALRLLRQIERLDPQNKRGLFLPLRLEVARAYARRGEYRKATGHLARLLQRLRGEQADWVRYYLGAFYAKQGERRRAEAHLRRVLTSPQAPAALKTKAAAELATLAAKEREKEK